MSILDDIVLATKKRVEIEKTRLPLEDLLAQKMPESTSFAFEKALKESQISFICEVKKASPSKGVIAEEFPYTQIAKQYEEAGAAAISVLTEPDFFQGKNEYLTAIRQVVSLPILRKDFIVDPYQIVQSKHLGADAILLICSILSPQQLSEFIVLADELGLSAITEAHDEKEVQMALEAGSRVIGVNNRDLHTFKVDINNSVRLRKLAPKETLFIAESGIQTAEDIDVLEKNHMDAVLIGEAFMKERDKKAKLKELKGELE
ncbi:indole-3-glycerol phosphate synthase TrpC [Jeotgalibaca ciconiae]|uniref:Indole-3-glycerol phosphate synthase n=1 Tax=Jeotgalibaca ciconiae TaxID=2496265 RepID=A0A3Q9BKR9_9LACT|nr:indole-3-glycerol phosphate synthase TrpC [Jeotgalibaca ciconiae]AZP04701.1 indole-3-glycerol phosphate synthase TrpC [Jeotgalibaca ciconiae]